MDPAATIDKTEYTFAQKLSTPVQFKHTSRVARGIRGAMGDATDELNGPTFWELGLEQVCRMTSVTRTVARLLKVRHSDNGHLLAHPGVETSHRFINLEEGHGMVRTGSEKSPKFRVASGKRKPKVKGWIARSSR